MKLSLIFFTSLLGLQLVAALPTPSVVGVNIKPRRLPTQSTILSIRGGQGEGEDVQATDAKATLEAALKALCEADNTAKGIATLSVVSSALMAFTPKYAMTKIFKAKNADTLSPNERQMVVNLGYSGLSAGLTSALLVFKANDVSTWEAVAYGSIPRFIVLVQDFLPHENTMNLNALLPVYFIISVCIAAMFSDIIPLEATMGAKIIGGIYLLAGLVGCLDPVNAAEGLKYYIKGDQRGQGLIRSQGKVDMVNGGLLLGLGLGYSSNKAIGLSCVAWFVAILLNDAILGNYKAMDTPVVSSLIQLSIALFASFTLFVRE